MLTGHHGDCLNELTSNSAKGLLFLCVHLNMGTEEERNNLEILLWNVLHC